MGVEVPQVVFREYDVRGVAGRDLTPPLARLIGRAVGEMARERGRPEVVVGRDNRVSSPWLRDAVVEGLGAAGCSVVDLGQVITPMFYFACTRMADAPGLMITASHNPGDENGFKIALQRGTLFGEQIQEVRRRVEALAARGLGEEPPARGAAVRFEDCRPDYVEAIASRIKLARPLRVVVDCGNGTASDIAPEVLRRLGCEVLPLFCESDPTFPNHHPDPLRPENLRDLVALVAQARADVGLALDGDGDRLGAVAEDGRILWGDQLMIFYWREILPRHPGATAFVEVKCSQGLWEEIERLGGHPAWHRTGHSYLKASLFESGAPFTGEMSGHLFFQDEYFGFDDALYAGARLLRILAAAGRPLGAMAAELPQYPSTPEVRVDCPDDRKFAVVAAVTEHFRGRRPVIEVDGARILFDGGWGLVRASNTQPALVLRCEARDQERLRSICAEIETALAGHPEVGAVRWS